MVFVVLVVTIWYILTELGSIVENAIAMGANVPAWLPKLLNATAHVVENVGKEVLDQTVKGHGEAEEAPAETEDEVKME